MQEEFYVTLPSNASMQDFPENSVSSYFVRLEKPLRLEGKWIVGMVEMHYPNSWDNVTDGRIIVNQKATNSAIVVFAKTGRYRTEEELIEEIRQQLSAHKIENSIQFSRDKITNRCHITVKENDLEIKLSQNLSNILGLEWIYYGYGYNVSERQCDITEGFTSLYVYSDIIKPQIVGDVHARLLRIVPVSQRNRVLNQVEYFQHVQYYPVAENGAETIQILIRRDDGRPVSFQSGKSNTILHFKKV